MNFLRAHLSRNQCICRYLCSKTPKLLDQKQLKIVKVFSQKELDEFSNLTGDFNKLHSDKIPAHQRLVHGAFLNGIIAGIIGTNFPDGTIVLEQKFKFPKPCRVNIECEFAIMLQEYRKISTISYECKQNNTTVFKGEAKLLIPNNNVCTR